MSEEEDVDRMSSRNLGINFMYHLQDLIRKAISRSESGVMAEIAKLREEVRELREAQLQHIKDNH